jgi:hypothetical protein
MLTVAPSGINAKCVMLLILSSLSRDPVGTSQLLMIIATSSGRSVVYSGDHTRNARFHEQYQFFRESLDYYLPVPT